jgi:hypothetical protein
MKVTLKSEIFLFLMLPLLLLLASGLLHSSYTHYPHMESGRLLVVLRQSSLFERFVDTTNDAKERDLHLLNFSMHQAQTLL